MDKLRSLHYFIASAEESSFSGAARRLGVSVAAVAKLVTALERSLGVRLFERHAHGLALTTGGSATSRDAGRRWRSSSRPTSRRAPRPRRAHAAPSSSACSR